jgi:hypothetical protein
MVTQVDRLGVAKADQFFSEAGWLFREQMVHDFGIDAHVEIVSDQRPTGELIAIQIKAGPSYFSKSNESAYIFRTDEKHAEYWLGHVLPVILVLVEPSQDLLLWQELSERTLVSTGKGWKIEVPKENVLDQASLRRLRRLNQPNPYTRKMSKLGLDAHLIRWLAEGKEVTIEFDDWINKSLPRYQLTVRCEKHVETWPLIYSPGMSIEDALEHLVPWANYVVDIEAHRQDSEAQWHAECYITYDKESGIEIFSQDFEDWYREPEGLVPVGGNGEIEHYRLQLTLNQLGESFIAVDEFLEADDPFEGRAFTLDEVLGR